MKPRRWTTIEETRIQECRVFDVRRVVARSPGTGRDHAFFGIGSSDWVNVIPLTPEGEVVMIHQYRHGERDLTLETPGGIVDPGEEPAVAAGRELLEETGFEAGAIESLGAINPNPALFGNRLHAFLARDVREVGEIANGETEETSVELVPLADARRLVAEGRVHHALVVASFYLAELKGALPD
jgi:8-oxo-dGTP pyrophosphatase MutT (NUDIX family)